MSRCPLTAAPQRLDHAEGPLVRPTIAEIKPPSTVDMPPLNFPGAAPGRAGSRRIGHHARLAVAARFIQADLAKGLQPKR